MKSQCCGGTYSSQAIKADADMATAARHTSITTKGSAPQARSITETEPVLSEQQTNTSEGRDFGPGPSQYRVIKPFRAYGSVLWDAAGAAVNRPVTFCTMHVKTTK